MPKHTDLYGAPPPFCYKCPPPDYPYARCAAGGYVSHPEASEKHPHRHHDGKLRQQNGRVVEKYRPRLHHRGYHKQRSMDDTLYEVSGLRMPETDFSDSVPWRLKAACY
ncbi:hypothetical protein AAVH_05446 [Aphelenchoides avenae]|nr:hypothetical protein AAVH_05446 [Aphelenchus avenae]